MIGTIVNAAAVVAGGLFGLLIKKSINRELADAAMRAVGVGVALIGVSGVMSAMLSVTETGRISADGGLLLLVSLVLGTVVGEALKIHDRVESLSGVLERKLGLEGFAKGFISASVLFCAGAMAIVGAFNDGLYGDHSVLFVKSLIDMISAIFLASTLGVGVVFSAVLVFLYQGALSLCAGLLAPVMTEPVVSAVGMTGFAIVMCIGINLMGAARIKTTNMVPALLFAAAIRLLGLL